MYQSFLRDAAIEVLLRHCDEDLAATCQKGGCLFCQGRLDQANYLRKPRGGRSEESGPEMALRLSFCCCVEGCRKRALPPSVRFLGRRVYGAVAVVVAGMGVAGVPGLGARQLQELIGVDRRTLSRWRRWWRGRFAQSRFWQSSRGRFPTPIAADDLPRELVDRFPGEARERLLAMLHFLSPLTAPLLSPSRGF